jgi:hypothetical protein
LISDDADRNKIEIKKYANNFKNCAKQFCGKYPCSASDSQKFKAQIGDCVYSKDVKEVQKLEKFYCNGKSNKNKCETFKNYLVKKLYMIRNRQIPNQSRNYWEVRTRTKLETCHKAACGGSLCTAQQQKDKKLREQWEACSRQAVTKAKDQIKSNCDKICCGLNGDCAQALQPEEKGLGLKFQNCKNKCVLCNNDDVLKTYMKVKDNISGRQLADVESWIANYESTGVELAGTTGNAKLNYEHYNYILVSCFTGWGIVSVKS